MDIIIILIISYFISAGIGSYSTAKKDNPKINIFIWVNSIVCADYSDDDEVDTWFGGRL